MHRALTAAAASVAAALALSAPASAICIMAVLDDTGALGVNLDLDQMSSANPGGAPVSFTVTTTPFSSHQLIVEQPTSFSEAPAGAAANAAFHTTVSATGATFLGQVLAGLGNPLGAGLTTVTVNTTVEKSSGIFPAGDYEVEVDIRCQ